MAFRKSDFIHWRTHPITAAFLVDVLEVADIEIAHLTTHAGKDSLEDRRRVGHIQGLKELADWQPALVEDDADDVESQGA